jgi:hypothetical protein
MKTPPRTLCAFLLLALATTNTYADNPSTNHFCYYPSKTNDVHVSPPSFGVQASAGGPYALSGTNVEIKVSGSVTAGTTGIHSNVTTFASCKCGNTNAPPTLSSPYPTSFADSDVKFDWTFGDNPKVEDYGRSFSGTKSVSKPGTYTLTANFKGARADCTRCTCEAGVSTNCTVYRLKVTPDPAWLGLDRTGTNTQNRSGKGTAELQLSGIATYKWSHSGVCQLADTNGNTVTYRTQDKESCSGSYRDQTITATADITSPQPLSLSATTNFTVVKVDVTVDGLNEEKEEKVGACLEYQADATNDIWTAEGTNALKGVSIHCWPLDLPANEMIKIEAPDGFLYEKVGEEYTLAQTSYKACEVSQKQFFLHGHVASSGLRDKTITVTHENSGAKDMAKFTVLEVEIVVELEDLVRNSVCSGLKEDTLKFELNGNIIDREKLTLIPTTNMVAGTMVLTALKVSYAPSFSEINLTGSNTVKFDIDDAVDNHMDQVEKTFKIQ